MSSIVVEASERVWRQASQLLAVDSERADESARRACRGNVIGDHRVLQSKVCKSQIGPG